MNKLVFLLPLFLNVSCVAYVEEQPSSQYCEVEYVETDYHGLVIPFFDDQKWYRDVIPCTEVDPLGNSLITNSPPENLVLNLVNRSFTLTKVAGSVFIFL